MDPARIDNRTLMLSLAAVAGAELLTASILSLVPGVDTIAFTGSVRLLEGAFILWIVAAVGPGLAALGFSRSTAARGIGRGLLWSAAFGALAAAAGGLLYWAGMPMPSAASMGLPQEWIAMVKFFLVAGLIGPVAEEIFFRGILFGFFRRWGLFLALTASTVLFAVVHPFQNLPVTQVIGGILFALSYEKEGTLLAPITIHVTGNNALFLLALWMRS